MTKEELEREYYDCRPTEPYSEDDSPNDWANIVQYAEENLGKVSKAIAELEKENAELKAKIEKMADCSNCKHWDYSTRLLAYFCDCSDKISDSIDSRTYEHCDKWELE